MKHARKLVLGGCAALLLGGVVPVLGDDEGIITGQDVFPVLPDAAPNHRYPDDSTPLMWAVYDGDHERAASLIAAGADANAQNRYGSNAMQLAAEVADVDALRMLLDAGADVDSPNPEGQTALMLVARTGNVDAARLLVEHGATVDAREGWGEQTALMWAAARRRPEMVRYLAEQGADMNARSKRRDYQRHATAETRAKRLDTGGLTPLLYAAREDCVACVEELIAHGVDVDKTDPDHVTPLLLAILNTNWDIAKRLLDAGADVNRWDIYGQAPLYAVASRREATAVGSIDPLNETSGDEVMRMLIERGADPDMQLFMRPARQRGGGVSRGSTPLHAAASIGDIEAVRMLLEAGADVNLNDTDNESAMMLAIQGGAGRGDDAKLLALMRVLRDAGIDVDANAMYHHLQFTYGGTALHYAVRSGDGRIVDELISYGVDVDIQDPDGLTALDYAMERGRIAFAQSRKPPRLDLAQKLRDAGAVVEVAEEQHWSRRLSPTYYDATIWPLGVDVPSRDYEDMEPSPYVVEAIEGLQYSGTPQPQIEYDQAALGGAEAAPVAEQ